MLRLRQFSPTDIGEIASLVYTSLGEKYSQSTYLNIYSQWPKGFVIAEQGGQLVGFIAGVLAEHQSARILMLGVKEKFRCQGIGSILLKNLMNESALKGLKSVHLEVRKSNVTAIRFYTRFGFQIAKVLPRYYSDGEDGYQMWRSL